MKIAKGNRNQKQQGDIVAVRIEAVPSEAVKQEPVNGVYVIAQGSAGGNAHVVNAAGVTAWKVGEAWVVEAAEAVLIHTATVEKHSDIVLDGLWRLDCVVETDPFSKLISAVRD